MAPPGSARQSEVWFQPFRLDLRTRRLYRGDEVVPLRPKSFAVLCALVERAGQVLSREELLSQVWPDVTVSHDMPRLCVGELRRALGDDARSPRYIETVPRAGYCFVAAVGLERRAPTAPAELVGRDGALAEIGSWLETALSGRRGVGFVTGEPGAGKTALLEAALEHIGSRRTADALGVQLATGQCVDQHGEGEPFLPVLEALARLERADEPTAGVAQRAASRSARLRELADRLESLAASRPLVLGLEDLHWSDPSTVALLALLAQRPEPAQLLLIATQRLSDARAAGHPAFALQRELVRKGLAHELALEGLTRHQVGRLSRGRLGAAVAPELTDFVFARSEGNPFFAGSLLDHLRAQGCLVHSRAGWRMSEDASAAEGVPPGARGVIEARIEALSREELRALEAAAVVGLDFDSGLAAAAYDGVPAGDPREALETVCEALVLRADFLDAAEDGHYSFQHALQRQVLYERLAPARRRRLHQAVGEALEQLRDPHGGPAAAALASHFERSGDAGRAVRYHREAAEGARVHFADAEVALHLEAALAQLAQLPDTPERGFEEFSMLRDLSAVLLGIRGLADASVGRIFARQLDLAERLEQPVPVFAARAELFFHHQTRAELDAAERYARQLLETAAEQPGFPPFPFVAHTAAGALCCNRGDFARAGEHLRRARELFDPSVPMTAPVDLGAVNLRYLADVEAVLDHAEGAREAIRAARDRASVAGRPADSAFGELVSAELATFLDDADAALGHAERALDVCKEFDLPLFAAAASACRGWALARRGEFQRGLPVLRGAIERLRDFDQRVGTPHLQGLLADASLRAGDAPAALEACELGLEHARVTGEHRHDSELLRLRGEALARHGEGADAAVACLERAAATAREQGARLLERRARAALRRLG